MPSVTLSHRCEVGGGLVLVALDVEKSVARTHTTPAQYLRVDFSRERTPDAHFVLANAVGKTPWELLVKNQGDSAAALNAMPIGTEFEVEGPLGAGVPLNDVVERHEIVAVVGSALAVARPVIEMRIASGAARATQLYLGIPGPRDLALAAEVRAWTEKGVEVVFCMSRAELAHDLDVVPRAKRESGYVQSVFARAVKAGKVPRGTLLVVAGPETMVSDMRSCATSANAHNASAASDHAPPSDVHIEVVTNY